AVVHVPARARLHVAAAVDVAREPVAQLHRGGRDARQHNARSQEPLVQDVGQFSEPASCFAVQGKALLRGRKYPLNARLELARVLEGDFAEPNRLAVAVGRGEVNLAAARFLGSGNARHKLLSFLKGGRPGAAGLEFPAAPSAAKGLSWFKIIRACRSSARS